MTLSVKKAFLFAPVIGALGVAGYFTAAAYAQTVSMTYTAQQAATGKTVYEAQCAQCHGSDLDNGEFGPPLRGVTFLSRWGGQSALGLMDEMTQKMPASAPGSLSTDEYTNVFAYILQRNTVFASQAALPSDPKQLAEMILPSSQQAGGIVGGLAAGVKLPPNPEPVANPLEQITTISAAMLRDPPPGDWLTWRRTVDDMGYSPLKQINKSNVDQMRVAWSWAMPSGPNEATPLVHDGVMFVQGYGDIVQALNAATGDLLWQFTNRMPKGSYASSKKAMAIFGDRLYVGVSEARVVCLDTKTGTVIWEFDSPGKGFGISGGPLVARNRVIFGTGGQGGGGNLIVALDMATGKEAWRFRTIPLPNEMGGETWNGLPTEKRSGASVWTPGSYDPDLNLVYFGVAQTYDTGPLRNRVKSGEFTNDGLFTDSTLAFNPETGKLVWYFQHMNNDQWDFDWVFERQVLTLPVNGKDRRVVITSGKPGIHDIMDAKTGQYLFSMDIGIQNFVKSIDPKTGKKNYNEDLIPGDGKTKFVCPHSGGGKNWMPSSFSPDTKLLYVTVVENCMDLFPVGPGEHGAMTAPNGGGVQWAIRPIPNSDGRYGRLQAVDLVTKKTVWMDRQRAPRASGTLATGGGLLFSGDVARMFSAYDDATGKKLWTIRLNDVPNSNPITYTVDGKQYVAMVVGNGGPQTQLFQQMVPEIKNPPNRTGAVWVFQLPSGANH